MLLTASGVDRVRAAFQGGRSDRVNEAAISGVTLGAAFELACTRAYWLREGREDIPFGTGALAQLPHVADAVAALTSRTATPVASFAAPTCEVAPIPPSLGDDCVAASLFQQRFSRSLASCGFPSLLARALTKALFEMADNVLQHSSVQGDGTGIWGYHVEPKWMSFAVADIGRGVLESLRANERHTGLATSEAALEAAVRNKASRRAGGLPGLGFDQVHRALASRNGVLRFRSGDATLSLDGRSGQFRATKESSSYLPGFQVVVTGGIQQNQGELAVSLT